MPGVSNKNKPALVDWLVEHPACRPDGWIVERCMGHTRRSAPTEEEAAEAQAFFDDLEREEEYDMMMEEMADSEDETDTDDDMGWGDNEYDREAAADNEEAAAYDKQLRQLEREDELEGSMADSEDGTDEDEDDGDDEDEDNGQSKGAPDAGRNRKRHSVGSVHSQERATKRTRQEAESRERETDKDEIMAEERREWARKEAEWAERERELERELGRLTREMVETSKGVPMPLRAE